MNDGGNDPREGSNTSEMLRAELMSSQVICARFTNVIFSESHGAFDKYLGVGYLYYGFAAAIRSQVSVCIGSGGGFVPDLLAQAQHDIGIEPAATYLIDANLPDLGFGSPVQPGGWLRPENDFRRRASDVVVLRMLSTDAARAFARERIRIDYLHIDGDHSRRGVVADFEDFAPLLSDDAVVSFHDAAMPSVRAALEQIRRDHGGWEYLGLPEIGAGSAFMRRIYREGSAARQSASQRPDRGRRTRLNPTALATAADDSADRARYERWHYLATPAFRSRYEVIAPAIDRDGGTVIEVGGFPNSVVDVLTRSTRVVAFEPYAPSDYVIRVTEEARRRGIDYVLRSGSVAAAEFFAENIADYALVCLGLDISAACDSIQDFEANLAALLRLARRAAIVAAEFPGYPPSIVTWAFLEAGLKPSIVRDVKLDLSADPVADEYFVKDNRAHRRIVVFRSNQHDSGAAPDAVRDCAARLHSLKVNLSPPLILAGKDGKFHFRAADLPSRRAENQRGIDGERTLVPGEDPPGLVTFGPYIRLQPGKYRAIVSYDSPANADTIIGRWDVCVDLGRQILLAVPLMGTGGAKRIAETEFAISDARNQYGVEVRVFYNGAAALCFRELVVGPGD